MSTPLNDVYIPLQGDPEVENPRDRGAWIDAAATSFAARITYLFSMRRILLFNGVTVFLFSILGPMLVYLGFRRYLTKASAERGVFIWFVLAPLLAGALVAAKSMFVLTAHLGSGGQLRVHFWGYAPLELGAVTLFLFVPALYYYEHVRRAALLKAPELKPGYASYLWRCKFVLLLAAGALVLAAGIESNFVL